MKIDDAMDLPVSSSNRYEKLSGHSTSFYAHTPVKTLYTYGNSNTLTRQQKSLDIYFIAKE